MSRRRIFTGRHVVLPDGVPRPATLVVDAASGTIADVREGAAARADFPDVADADWVDAGELYVLPGVVECVCSIPFAQTSEAPLTVNVVLDTTRVDAP